MILNLQSFNRLTTGKMEMSDLHSIIDDMLMLCWKDLSQKKIKVVRKYGADIAKIPLIIDQIKQVVLNLLSNSGEAMAESGGEIIIKTSQDDDKISLKISDTGDGVDPHMMDLIFQPFFTTKSSSQGTGLGLSLSREIVKRHGGSIKATNNPHGGATFTVELPYMER
jgi:two-component system NtrC family sensor kinase